MMESTFKWQKQREEWLKETNKYVHNDIYKTNDINLEVLENARAIIESTKGPYPAFHKKISLPDLIDIARDVFDDSDN